MSSWTVLAFGELWKGKDVTEMLREADEESNILTFSCRLCSLFLWNSKRSCKIREAAYGLNPAATWQSYTHPKVPALPPSTQLTHKVHFEPVAQGKMISVPRSPPPSGNPGWDWEMLQEEELEWHCWGTKFNFKTKKLLLLIVWDLDCIYRNIHSHPVKYSGSEHCQ